MKTNGSLEVAPEALDLAQLKTSRSKAGTLLCGFHRILNDAPHSRYEAEMTI